MIVHEKKNNKIINLFTMNYFKNWPYNWLFNRRNTIKRMFL